MVDDSSDSRVLDLLKSIQGMPTPRDQCEALRAAHTLLRELLSETQPKVEDYEVEALSSGLRIATRSVDEVERVLDAGHDPTYAVTRLVVAEGHVIRLRQDLGMESGP